MAKNKKWSSAAKFEIAPLVREVTGLKELLHLAFATICKGIFIIVQLIMNLNLARH
ncbi:hypothetical protein [Legionella tunisiensis]|uniref:hypothetical protein n=1 Tax=Legionella tunisiensis TaxID=1034944 RepID=UPI0002F437FC|nr:hypothetical protein [Legionella tunisiensis]